DGRQRCARGLGLAPAVRAVRDGRGHAGAAAGKTAICQCTRMSRGRSAMRAEKLEQKLEERLAELGRSGLLKGDEAVITGVVPPTGGKGPRFLLEGHGAQPFLRMNSNSYLGLSLDAEVKAAEDRAVLQYGTGPGAVRFISGTWAPHIALERRLAAFHGREAAMLFSSAYATVMGLLPQLITDRTAVTSDELNH